MLMTLRTATTILALASLVSACTLTKRVNLMPAAGGEPARVVFHSGFLAQSGDVEALFPGNRVLRGRWTALDSGSRLDYYSVTTPSGVVTATALSQYGLPSGIASLNGAGVTALCVFTGTFQNGAASCVDSEGRRYFANW